jgi:hypothetical protein
MWEIAGGVIIGGGVLGIIWLGFGWETESLNHEKKFSGYGFLLSLVGAAIGAWIVLFKAHF